MSGLFKLLAAALAALIVGLFSTGIERIVWIYSGSGLQGVVPKSIYATIADIHCDRPSIEVKRDADGVLRYRCGDYWLFSHAERSPALTEAWPRIKPALTRNPNS